MTWSRVLIGGIALAATVAFAAVACGVGGYPEDARMVAGVCGAVSLLAGIGAVGTAG